MTTTLSKSPSSSLLEDYGELFEFSGFALEFYNILHILREDNSDEENKM